MWWRIDPFPNKPWLLCVCTISLLKTLWEKEKLLVPNNFSFSLSVLYPFGDPLAIFIKCEFLSAKSFSLEQSKIFFSPFHAPASKYQDILFYQCPCVFLSISVCPSVTNLTCILNISLLLKNYIIYDPHI